MVSDVRRRLVTLPRPAILFPKLSIVPHLLVLTLRRLRSRPMLTLLALLGVVLAVGMLSSTGFFAQAVDRAILQEELTELSSVTGRPPFSSRIYYFPSSRRPMSLAQAETVARDIGGALSGEIGLPLHRQGLQVESAGMMLLPGADDARYAGSENSFLNTVTLLYIANVAEQVEIVEGEGFAEAEPGDSVTGAEPGAPPTLDVWMHARLAAEMGVDAGETFDVAVNLGRTPQPIRVRGLWQAADPLDPFWFNNPDMHFKSSLLVRRADYIQYVEPTTPAGAGVVSWLVALDEARINPVDARRYVSGFGNAMSIIEQFLPGVRLDVSALNSLEDFVQRQTTLTATLLGFNVPALGFLLAFLALVSLIITDWQRRETSILVSRGMGRRVIFGLTVLEELVLYVVGVPLGIACGMGLAHLMGRTVSFLEFTTDRGLPISLQGLSWQLIAIALLTTLLARLLPALAAARHSVLVQEREATRPSRPPWWQRTYLDLLLVIPTYYAYQQMAQHGSLGSLLEERADDLLQDPLMILLPAMMVFCGALLAMRLFLLITRALDLLAHRMPLPTVHLALRQLSRYSHGYVNPLLLVIVSLGLGIYTFTLAASLDQWLIDRVYYSVGGDVSFLPYIESESGGDSDGAAPNLGGIIPTKDDFEELPGVSAAGRVGHYPARITAGGGGEVRGHFLGIDRVDFPHSAWFRSDFAPESLGALMNRLAMANEHVLVSQRFLERNGLRIGDTLPATISMEDGFSIHEEFTVAGIYNYFPTVYDGVDAESGSTTDSDSETIIGNLDYLFFQAGGAFPHYIWLHTEPESGEGELTYPELLEQQKELFRTIESTGISAVQRRDAQALIAEEQAQFERVGIFGTLSVGFLAAALMAALTLLVYSYASLRDRLYQFGVLRAIGLYGWQVLGQIVLEYGLIIAFGAAAGLWIGAGTSQLFAPFFRITGGAEAMLPPLLPIIESDKIVRLALIFAATMICIEVAVVARALTQRLFDALRMGHQG